MVEALGNFAKDHVVYDALINALHNDASYAAEAAAAEGIGKSGAADMFDVLQAEAAAKPEVHVMQATLAGLAATKDPRAVAILLAQAQPGADERIRLSALAGLAGLKDAVEREHAQELAEVVRGALDDPYLPVREAGERLAGTFDLTQFRGEIQRDADAPLVFQRDLAQKMLQELHR